MVTDNKVIVEILAKRMAVHGNAREAIFRKPIIDNHVAVSLCAGHRIENADSCTRSFDGKAIIGGLVFGDGVVVDTQRRARWPAGWRSRRMRGECYSAVERVVSYYVA